MPSPVLRNSRNFQPNRNPEYNDLYQGQAEPGVMTVQNTMTKAFGLFGILIVGAAIGWAFPILAIPGAIIGLVLGLVNSFKRQVSVPLIILYAVFEGLFLGGISGIFENIYPGVVSQAVLATLAVTGVTLALFTSGRVRATPRMTKFFLIAMLSYLAFSVLNFVLVATGALQNPYGIRGMEIFGIPVGIVIGLFAVLLATYSLILDFTYIQNAADNRAPEKQGWYGAFGIMVTVVWLYTEILRILGLLRS